MKEKQQNCDKTYKECIIHFMKNMNRIRLIAGTGIFSALTIVFTLISNYIQIGTISINLSLLPITLSAIVYGPIAGLITGIVNGLFILLAPSTSAFFAISVYGTVIVCLVKSSVAGVLAGLIYKFIKNKLVGLIIAAVSAPIINTGLFIVGSLIFFNGAIGELISIFVTVNFAIEFISTIILIPGFKIIVRYADKKGITKEE